MAFSEKAEKEEGPFHLEISIPLLLRSLEWAREEAKDDIELHEYVENMIANGHLRILVSSDYEKLLPKKGIKEKLKSRMK